MRNYHQKELEEFISHTPFVLLYVHVVPPAVCVVPLLGLSGKSIAVIFLTPYCILFLICSSEISGFGHSIKLHDCVASSHLYALPSVGYATGASHWQVSSLSVQETNGRGARKASRVAS